MAEALIRRFGHKVYLVGDSWGTFLGVLLAKARPDLIAAFVGSGQMVNLAETDTMFYEDGLAYATKTGQAAVVEALIRQGPPPYENTYDYEVLFALEGSWNAYPRDPALAARLNPLTNVLGRPELPLLAKVRYGPNFVDTFAAVYPEANTIDLRKVASTLEVPVYVLLGDHEARGRAVLAQAWFAMLKAPAKHLVAFPNSGHNPFTQEVGRFLGVLRQAAAAHPA
ncbi:MAG: alpha/beta hydrolase [Propionibacteriaceae bacterium]|nr:alpha/beta hydrolase [Micropruina sp.]